MLRMLLVLGIASSGAGCGGQPALANAPRPNTAAVAGAAAAIAGAATLAAPNAQAARVQEANKDDDPNKPQKSGGTVPPDVFDRLDQKKAKNTAPGSDPEPAEPPPGAEP